MYQIETSYSEFKTGVATVGTSPLSLDIGSGEDRLHNGITLKADAGNSGTIFVGCKAHPNDNEVSSANYPLAAGESVTMQVEQVGKVRVVATDDDQVLHWIGS